MKRFFFFADSVYETLPLVQLPGKEVNHQLLGSRYCLYTYNIKETLKRIKAVRLGILTFFDHRQNYLETEGNRKIMLYKDGKTPKR